MRFRLEKTSDGSLTVFDTEAGECFKSRHAARTEAEEVFFVPGVLEHPAWRQGERPFRILELGFGLGTNATHLKEKQLPLEIVSIERDLSGVRFFLQQEPEPWLTTLVETGAAECGPFRAQILAGDFFAVLPELHAKGERFHAIYFDPFSPKANPNAWTHELFVLAAKLLLPEGRLVTYSVSRLAKDAAAAAGLRVEKRTLAPKLRKKSSLLAVKMA